MNCGSASRVVGGWQVGDDASKEQGKVNFGLSARAAGGEPW